MGEGSWFSGRRELVSERWELTNRRRQLVSGRWKLDNRRWELVCGIQVLLSGRLEFVCGRGNLLLVDDGSWLVVNGGGSVMIEGAHRKLSGGLGRICWARGKVGEGSSLVEDK
jgi:hypothetical protein